VATGVTTTVMLKDPSNNPISKLLRWQLTVTGSPSSAWESQFRLFLAGNVVGASNHTTARSASRPLGVCGCLAPATMVANAGACACGSGKPASIPLHFSSR
jgi:hypothetical protein